MPIIRDLNEARRQKARRTQPPSIDGCEPIRVVAGELPRVAREAEDRLVKAAFGIYQRAGRMVRVAAEDFEIAGGRTAAGPRVVEVTAPYLRERLTAASGFVKFDGRANDWVPIDAPSSLADVLLSRTGEWKLPPLTAITTGPTLRPDGSIHEKPGYDPLTGILFVDEGVNFHHVSRRPDYGEAQTALHKIFELVKDFPFVGRVDRSVWASAVLSAVCRYAVGAVPIHAVTAVAPGSGKSHLCNMVSIIATGRPAPVLGQGLKDEEFEKKLVSAALAGDGIIAIDNCARALSGDLVCQIVTQPTLRLRVLGVSELIDVPGQVLMLVNGNNLRLTGDLPRRSILCRLDARVERPELRRFKVDPSIVAARHRARFLALALTVLRGFINAGRPSSGLVALGSFEGWSNLVRDSLVWLGEPDPVASMQALRSIDPKLQAAEAVALQWHATFGVESKTVREVIAHADLSLNGDLKEALLAVAGDRGVINGRRLGNWLATERGAIRQGLMLQDMGQRQGVSLWRVAKVDPQ